MEEEWKILYYDKNHILGQGSYATVFKGKLVKKNGDDAQVIDVAIKRLEKLNLNHWPDETISMEIKIIKQKKLNHPNVVTFLYMEEQDDDFLYFALELCAASLDKVFLPKNDPEKYKGPLPSDIDFMLQLSLGLEYIHSEDLVHRDIKPGNVLIFITSTREAVMKWADFGLSKETKKGEYFLSGYRGTQQYMAPEILVLEENDQIFEQRESDDDAVLSKKVKLTNKSDVFSCALVFFKYFTRGCHPFGKNEEITSNIRQSNPVNLRELPENHFSFSSIRKMISNNIQERPNLREIILLLSCLQQATKNNPFKSNDEFFWDLRQKHKELCDLCSIRTPVDEQQLAKLTRIVVEDTIGLINLTDQDGHSPLQLACARKKFPDLLLWVQVMTMKQRIRDDGTDSKRVTGSMINYQNRVKLNALNYVLMNYEEAQSQEIKNKIAKHHSNETMKENIDSLACVCVTRLARAVFSFFVSTEVDQIGVNTRHLKDLVKYFIENGMDLTAKTKNGLTILHHLCQLCHIHKDLIYVMKLLIENGADVNAKTYKGWTALLYLIEYSSHENLIEFIKVLIEFGADVTVRASIGAECHWSALHLLCRRYRHSNLIDLIRLLIDNGVDINAKLFPSGLPALYLILCNDCPEDILMDVFQFFINNGFNMNVCLQDLKGPGLYQYSSILYFLLGIKSKYSKLCDLVKLLIENGLFVDPQSFKPLSVLFRNENLRHSMTKESLIDLVQLLTPDGFTALHSFCAFYSHKDLIDFLPPLIEKDIEINAKTYISIHGNTALHLLCQNYRHDDLIRPVKLLIENGADVNAKDSEGWTALHNLCFFYNHENLIDILKLFIGHGADGNAKTKNGTPAICFLCEKYSHSNIIELLQLFIDNGAESIVNFLDLKNGREYEVETFYSLFANGAQRNNLPNILRFLIGKGIDVSTKSPDIFYGPYVLEHSTYKTSDDPEFFKLKPTLNKREFYTISGNDPFEWLELLSEDQNKSHGNLIDLVRLLIESDIDVKLIDCEGVATLYFPYGNYTNYNLIDLIQFLIDEKDFDIKAMTYDGWTALHFLCRYYSEGKLIDIFKWMITKDIDLTVKLPDGRNVLHILCQYYKQDNLIDLVRILFQNGIHVDQRYDRWNALSLLCEFYDQDKLIDLVELMIDNGVHVNKKSFSGWTALHLLCQNYHRKNLIEIIQILIENGIDINAKTLGVRSLSGMTALHLLCQYHSHDNLIELVRLLIDNGVDVNSKDLCGTTALVLLCHNYAFDNLIELVRLLIEHGVDLNADPTYGFPTALHIVCQKYRHDNLVNLVELMIDSGVNATAKALENEVTALHLLCMNKAQRCKLTNIVELLIRKGIDVTLKDQNGRSVLDFLHETWKLEEIDPYLIELLSIQTKSSVKRLTDHLKQIDVENGINPKVDFKYFEGILSALRTSRIQSGGNVRILIRDFEQLIEEDLIDINKKDSHGTTALHIFVKGYPYDNLIDLLRFLVVEKGADVNAKTSHGASAIHVLFVNYCHKNLIDVAQFLIEHGGDITAKMSEELNVFHLLSTNEAIYTDYNSFLNITRWLMRNGVDVNQRSSQGGWTAFHLLCQKCNNHNNSFCELVQFLIEEGVDVTIKNSDDLTALHILCGGYVHNNLINLARLLIGKGTDVNAKRTSDGCTALHYLCQYYSHDNLIELIQLFIDNKANINLKNSYGSTALHLVCQNYPHNNLIDLIRLFFKNGVDISSKNSGGWNNLHILCRYYNHDNLIEMIRLFIENDRPIDLTAKTFGGSTALNCLCENYKHDNLIDLVQLLIGDGVDINAKDPDGWTALYSVCRFYTHGNLINIVQLLINSGADVNKRDTDGLTALYFLCKSYTHDNLIDIVQLLIDNGADVNIKDSDGLTALDYVAVNFSQHDHLLNVIDLLMTYQAK